MNSHSSARRISLRGGITLSSPRSLLIGLIACASLGLAGHAAASPGPAVGSGLTVRQIPPSRIYGDVRPGLTRSDRIVVKFQEDTQIRMRQGRLVSLDPAVNITEIESWLGRHANIQVTRHFARDEAALDLDRAIGQSNSPSPLADLNLYYEMHLPAETTVPQASALLAELRALRLVEVAFVEPIAQPAVGPVSATAEALGQKATRPGRMGAGPGLPTPDYSGGQGYLYASPSGVNAQAVWGYPGGRGAGVRIVDIEGAWLWNHEDLKQPFFTGGTPINDSGWRNHGTAVMGEMVGGNNGFGVTGIASDMQVGGVSIGDLSVAAAIDLAAANESTGDLFLIELHAPGPNSNGSGQFGYVPMEFWQDNFDAIQNAVARGRICIEAGGNGEQNLDDPVYHSFFDRNYRYSGAILVGAGTPTGLVAEWFTNYGSRLDLEGWGDSVYSTGYGDLQGGNETQWYTAGFSGTSSASPIIAGSVSSLQGQCKAMWGINLNGPLAMQMLYQTGTPWSGNKRIGNRPNLVAARALLQQGIGVISGQVTDAATHAPIAGVSVYLVENMVLVVTDANGNYSVPSMAGNFTVRVSDFFHQTDEQVVTVTAGSNTVHNVALQPLPAGSLDGTIVSQTGAPLPGAKIYILNTPIPSGLADGGGSYAITGIPAGTGYGAVYGLIPTRGAAFRSFDINVGLATVIDPYLVDAQTFEANNGGYTGDSPWAWGTPINVGPPGAFSGTKCWATNLSGNYGDGQTAYLTSQVFNFSGAGSLYLSFTHYYELESGFDGGDLQVKTGLTWHTVAPYGGYPFAYLDGLAGDSGFSGFSGGWVPAVFNLTPYISNSVQIRFHFGSDSGVNYAGWYIDDVAFDTGDAPTAVDSNTLVFATNLSSQPNPFAGAAQIHYSLPRDAQASLRVYDATGRTLRVLVNGPAAAGAHVVTWDGLDSVGRPVANGTYFYTLAVDGKTTVTQRMIRVR